jgi:hypothetical protein
MPCLTHHILTQGLITPQYSLIYPVRPSFVSQIKDNPTHYTGPSLLVAEARLIARGRAVASRSRTGRGIATVPIFLLVPQVKLPKRLDLARDAERAHDAVPGLIVAKWVESRF